MGIMAEDESIRGLKEADLYISSVTGYDLRRNSELRKYITEDLRPIRMDVTFSRASVDLLQTYAEGTKALLVNQNKHMAMECIAQLYHLGISNIEFYPCYPQGAGLSTAITAAAVIGGSYFGDNLSMISGTVGLAREYGGIEWFVTKIRAKIRKRRSAEYGIGLLSGVLLIATIATIQLGLLRTPTGTEQTA